MFSMSLSSEQFCHKVPLDVKSRNPRTRCSYEPSIMQQNCLAKQSVVLKSIRVANITRLKSLYEKSIVGLHGTLDLPAALHVLHLVRDPRATLHSRMNMGGYFEREYRSAYGSAVNVTTTRMLEYSANRLCEQIGYTILVGESNLPWLQGRYLRVRFEDIALDPVVQISKLFHHYGLEMTSKVLQWIENNTHNDASVKTALNTKRNSTSAVDSWKPWLKSVEGRQYVKIIEEQCRDVMRHLGYDLAM